jgi:hypothetical protein
MKKILWLAVIFLSSSIPAKAQGGFTTVIGTVKDPAGITWACGTISAQLITAGGAAPTLNGGGFTTQTSPVQLGCPTIPGSGASGSFVMRLADSGVISPSNTTWKFTVGTTGTPPPLGTGPQSFTYTTAITCSTNTPTTCTSNQLDISTPISALAPAIGAGGGGIPNSPLPAASSGPGPVFNVKNYGAKGTSQFSTGCSLGPGSTNLNCPNAAFTAAVVNQNISCNGGYTHFFDSTHTITGFVNATNVTVSTSGTGGGLNCLYGPPDDAAVAAALAAAVAQVFGTFGSSVRTNFPTSAPILYFPAGTYSLSTSINVPANNGSANNVGFKVLGDGAEITKIYWHSDASTGGLIFNGITNSYAQGLTLDGGLGFTSFYGFQSPANETVLNDFRTQGFKTGGMLLQNAVFADYIVSQNNNGPGFTTTTNTNGYIKGGVFSNNGANANLIIGAGYGGFYLTDTFSDSCGAFAGGCVQFTNAQDVYVSGGGYYGTGSSGPAMNCDGTSVVQLDGVLVGTFLGQNNSSGMVIQAGCLVSAGKTRFQSSGTGKCVTNSGILLNAGGNSCESVFAVSSGTSTGTTAVLTLTNAGAAVNANCTVGDALQVYGVSPAGYNGYFPAGATSGITATSATTLTYTTPGSNIGATAGGGTSQAACRNMQAYSGNLPKSITPMVQNFSEGVVNLAASTIGTWTPDRGMVINRITAANTAGNVTCATPLVIQVSNGTQTQSLTLTSGQGTWDSGAGTFSKFFIGNTAVTVSQTAAAACATPPVNLNISVYGWTAMDN